jgi:hypothetical protein
MRLRQTHPPPRLTIDKAKEVLEQQETEMGQLDEQVRDMANLQSFSAT